MLVVFPCPRTQTRSNKCTRECFREATVGNKHVCIQNNQPPRVNICSNKLTTIESSLWMPSVHCTLQTGFQSPNLPKQEHAYKQYPITLQVPGMLCNSPKVDELSTQRVKSQENTSKEGKGLTDNRWRSMVHSTLGINTVDCSNKGTRGAARLAVWQKFFNLTERTS